MGLLVACVVAGCDAQPPQETLTIQGDARPGEIVVAQIDVSVPCEHPERLHSCRTQLVVSLYRQFVSLTHQRLGVIILRIGHRLANEGADDFPTDGAVFNVLREIGGPHGIEQLQDVGVGTVPEGS